MRELFLPVIILNISEQLNKLFTLPLLATCFHADILLSLFFDHEDGGDMFLQNIS
jgi:hypothetical protein